MAEGVGIDFGVASVCLRSLVLSTAQTRGRPSGSNPAPDIETDQARFAGPDLFRWQREWDLSASLRFGRSLRPASAGLRVKLRSNPSL